MIAFEIIFSVIYMMYHKSEESEFGSRIRAIPIVSLIQFLLIFTVITLLESQLNLTIFKSTTSISLFILVLIASNFLYFSEKKAKKLVANFNNYTVFKKRTWLLITVILFFLPLIYLMRLFFINLL